jgi:GNAT superfamily N-acetyltransferase
MRIEPISKLNVTDFLSLFNEGSCKDCYCTALYNRNWDEYNPQSPENRKHRMSIIDSGISDGFLFYQDNELIGWVQVGDVASFPNLINTAQFFSTAKGKVITCFKLKPQHRGKGYSSIMIKLITNIFDLTTTKLFAIPNRYDGFDEGRSWTGTVNAFLKNGFTEIQNGNQDYIVMEKTSAQQGNAPEPATPAR